MPLKAGVARLLTPIVFMAAFLVATVTGAPSPVSADTISQNTGTAMCASNWMGQTFVPQNSGPLTSIAVTFAFRGTGTGSARMKIYTMRHGQPN